MLIKQEVVRDFLSRKLDDFYWVKGLDRDMLYREIGRCDFKTAPWLHQLACFYIGLTEPEFLFLLDMGLGKTKLAADLAFHWIAAGRVDRALVGVPRAINVASWGDDLREHSFTGSNLVTEHVIEEKWRKLSQPDEGLVTVVDYQSLALAVTHPRGGRGKGSRELVIDERRIRVLRRLYKMLVMDESHKLANHESLWFAVMRRLGERAWARYAMTGTLFGKDPQAAWPQFRLVDGGETLGQNMGAWRASFFKAKANAWGRGEVYTYDKANDRTLHRMLRHRSIVYSENEVHDIPKMVPRVHAFHMTDEQRGHYMDALEGLINAGGVKAEMDGQWVRMRRICSGYLAWNDDSGSHVVRFKENPKLDALLSLVERTADSGRKLVVSHEYTESGRIITEALTQMKVGHVWLYGGTKDKAACRRTFMDDPSCKVFVMNSEAGGTGTDGLQKVAHRLVFFESPTNPITRRQTIKRVHRPGQLERSFLDDLVMRRSIEPGILEDIKQARDSYESIVNGKRKPGRGFFLADMPDS